MINFTSLYYFVMVATDLNMTKSANKLHISQQTLSFHISKLEDDYGTPLFDRKPSLHLTYAGELCLKHALKILTDCDLLTNQMAAVSGHCIGKLRISMSSHPAQLVLPHILPEFRRKWPNISLEFLHKSSAARIDELLEHQLDIGIGIYHKRHPHIVADFLFDDWLYLLASDDLLTTSLGPAYLEILQSERMGTDLMAFSNVPFMLLSDSTTLGNTINSYFAKIDLKPKVVLSTESLDILESLVPSGIGAMICGRLRTAEVLKRAPNIKAFPLSDQKAHLSHHFKLITAKDYDLPEYGKDFIRLTKSAFNRLDAQI